MLVFISDLHLRDDKRLTVSPKMTREFIKQNVIPQVEDAGARELIVVFLGDIFEINRSWHWVDGSSGGFKPWSHWKSTLARIKGKILRKKDRFDSGGFEKNILAVLSKIKAANEENYAIWKEFKNTNSPIWRNSTIRPEKITFEYIPGNHDRLIQFSPAIRSQLRHDFGFDYPQPQDLSAPFRWLGLYPDYSVVALHGHLFDGSNYGGKKKFPDDPLASPWYDFPSIGDMITVKFGAELVERFKRVAGGAVTQEMIYSLARIDLVRPITLGGRWLRKWKVDKDEEVRAQLDRVLLGLICESVSDEFTRWWFGIHRILVRLLMIIVLLFRSLINMETLLRLFQQFSGSPKSVPEPAANAGFMAWIRRPHGSFKHIVLGHTHRPTVVPLEGGTGDDARDETVYINTGTWLDVIEEGRQVKGGFALRNQITHVTFYKDNEDIKSGGTKRSYWEFWHGNLREGPAS